MYLVLALLDRAEAPERAIERLREFGVLEPLVVRARSAATALSAEVPIFAGLRSLALGADEDRLILISWVEWPSAEEAGRVLTRIQLEMDADDPPMGKVLALPVMSSQVKSGR